MTTTLRLRRVLVANRGEIAVRIIRACRLLGLRAVLAASDADLDSLPAQLADDVVRIGPASPNQSYLRVEQVVAAALATRCDAIHPGYGFLSERAELAAACAAHGLVFVGPSAETIRRGGDKVEARRVARAAGVPTGAGSDAVGDTGGALAIAEQVGFPILLKAAAGGGGRGMVRVDDTTELADRFGAASHEAEAAFGDGRLYLERYVEHARHVEVQLLGDHHGSIVHLGDRDCSIQRRFQKLIEEAPAPALSAALRARMADAAVALGRHLGYVGAGTVEFLVDLDREEFSFLEVNTRVQVEHPVTEMVTGVDIVQAQLEIAAGRPLSIDQSDVVVTGHAIECRINAESAVNGFLPTPGAITAWELPTDDHVRVDSHCYAGYEIPPFYDSLLAKLVVTGSDRREAIARTMTALDRLRIEGVETTAPLHRDILAHADFRSGSPTTRWLEATFLPTWSPRVGTPHRESITTGTM